jgi:hypothetical protein
VLARELLEPQARQVTVCFRSIPSTCETTEGKPCEEEEDGRVEEARGGVGRRVGLEG